MAGGDYSMDLNEVTKVIDGVYKVRCLFVFVLSSIVGLIGRRRSAMHL